MAAWALALVVLGTSESEAEPWPGWSALERDLSAAIDGHAQARQARYPRPIAIKFKPRRIADFNFDQPVLAAIAANVDGSGPDELVILTSTELIVLGGVGGGKLHVSKRVDLKKAAGGIAARRPRDPRGEISLDRGSNTLWVRSSELASGVKVALGGELAGGARFSGFPSCAPGTLPAVPGRSLMVGKQADLPALLYAARCGHPYYGDDGQDQIARAVLDSSGTLSVAVFGCQSLPCKSILRVQAIADAGSAFALADIDRDGLPELVSAAGGAPNARERVSIFESRPDSWRSEARFDFSMGAVAIVVGQFDDDEELEVVSLHRKFRSLPVEVWRWN